jgi:starch phosphorylase
MSEHNATIAYFSMEIALEPAMPTYSGGLGVLAGDTIRSAADLKVPMVAVTLLHRKGYFHQKLDPSGWQTESPADWPVEKFCRQLPAQANVLIEGREVKLKAWQYTVKGSGGHEIPVLLLDTDLPTNAEWDRTLTHWLYGGDAHYRLCQEAVLGMGGVRMLGALRFDQIRRFHMNEGHSSLLTLELLREQAVRHARRVFNHEDVEQVRQQCVFTTHTPVPAGHDQFPLEMVRRLIGPPELFEMKEVFCCEGGLNMTYLALNLSHYVNGVAKRHGEVSRQILTPRDANHHYQIDSITNGVHLATWAAPSFAALFDRHIPGWREDNSSLRNALRIPTDEIWQAHAAAKERLLDEVNRRAQVGFASDAFTLGFARRATTYKRASLLFTDTARLKSLAARFGRMQVLFAGKAHPHDEPGKHLIQHIVRARESLHPEVNVVYLENYDWVLARLLVAGVDVWLNTPQPPLEASGTSGMKAALNGVPSLSVLDGWWMEGCIEDVTGWAIGDHDATTHPTDRTQRDAASLYEKLERVVLPRFHQQRDQFVRIMRQAIALNASHFNTQRMVQEYVVKAYFT